MASLTSRLAGWAAGRIGGSKAKKKTMEFMDKTGVGKALSFGGDILAYGGAGKLLGAAGRGMGLLKAKGAAAGAAGGLKALPKVGQAITSMPAKYGITPGFGAGAAQAAEGASRLGNLAAAASRGVGRVTDYLGKRPEILGQGLMASAQARTGAANRELEREALAQREAQFQQTFKQSEDERQREMERQRRIAELLAPVFQRVAGGQG